MPNCSTNYKSLWLWPIIIFTVISVHLEAQTPRTVPTTYAAGILKSYVRTWNAKAPESDPNTLMGRPLNAVQQATQYFDGLGRPLQTVVKQASLITNGTPVDMISAVEYDAFEREPFKYLPTPSTVIDATKNDGNFKLNPFAQQATFYNSSSSSSPLYNQNETFFYGQTVFEASPLNRVSETAAVGNSWTGTMYNTTEANRRSVKTKYYVNTATDGVRVWNVTNVANALGTYSTPSGSAGIYIAGALFKNITVDENGKQVIEFKDKEDKVILKKAQLTATADDGTGSSHTGWLCTYYIYDDLNNLRCVIQPRGVELISSTWVLTDPTILAEQCFRYEYDMRFRMIMKKVPGAATVDMVYDARDRLVMSQDGNLLLAGKWMVTKYDNLNRPIESGLLTDATTPFATHLSNAYNSTTYPSTATGYEQLTITHFDNYTSLPSGLSSSLLTTWNTYFSATNNTTWPYPQLPAASNATVGDVTWTQTKILGSSPAQFISTVSIYDDKNRVVQVQSINITGGLDVATTQYTWAGQPLVAVQVQQKNTLNAQTSTIVSQLTYDDLGRILKTEKKVANTLVNAGSMPSSFKTTSQLQYDQLGQLKAKTLSPSGNNGGPLETLTYDYNIRGWMLGTNRDFAKTVGSTTNYFGFDLGYDKNSIANSGGTSIGTYVTPAYNGNIEGTVWKSIGDGQIRKYDFNYDAVNRLMKADFNQYTSSTFNKTANVDFTVKMGDGVSPTSAYDANCNIVSMTQYGLKLNSSPIIDQLTYTPQTNSNKLSKVTDVYNDNTSTLGDFKYDPATKATTDYSYDVNGNLTLDNNKKISSITYNHLNLPSVITVTDKGSITYTYDAGGNKQKKVTQENNASVPYNGTSYTSNITTTTTYISGLVYESKSYSNGSLSSLNYTDVLQFMGQEEGRIRFIPVAGSMPAGLRYDYFLKDHLGNVRMVLAEVSSTDIPNYYPAASLEGTYDASSNSMVNYERQFYNISSAYIVPETSIPSWGTETTANTKLYYNHNGNPPSNLSYPADCTPVQTTGSTKLYKLNATTNKTGLEFMIKVMSGDHVDIFGKSYYLNTTNVTNTNSTTLDVLSLLTNLLLSPGNAAAAKGITNSQLNTMNNGLIPTSFFRGNNSEPTTQIPKAYINYIFLDEQFKYAGGGASRVGTSGVVKDHWQADAQLQNIAVPKNGYIFVYVSNESNFDVFFDNLQVIHKPGPLLEETHYYPFGLTMAGISSKAAGSLINKKLFNGNELQSKEFNDGSGLELYDFNARTYDQQVGRFIQIDPTPEDGNQEGLTPYHFSGNNPSTFNDPNGKCPWCLGAIVGAAVEYGTQVASNLADGKSLSESLTDIKGGQILIAAGAGALSGGVSAFVPKGAAAGFAVKGVKLAIDAGESAAKQYDKTGSISAIETLKDVGTNIVAGKLTENVKFNSSSTIKTTEKQLNRAKRIAAGDATSSGRAATVKKLEGKVSSQKAANAGAQQAASGAVSNTMQAGVGAIGNGQAEPFVSSSIYNNTPAVDNTTVKKIIPIHF